MTQYAFYLDGKRCTGCKTCEMACKDYYDLSTEFAYRKIYEYAGGSWSEDENGCPTATIAGAVVAIVAVAAQLVMLANANTAVASGQEIAAAVAPCAIVGLVLVAVSAAELVRGFTKGVTRAVAVRSLAEVTLGAFLIRLTFYAMYLSVGVTLL